MNQKPQVMVVDDDLATCAFLQEFLAARGYDPMTLSSSDEAVRQFQTESARRPSCST
jgi:DNA-binding response OmpR family regulator